MPDIKYKRVLLKLSGEALAGEDKFGVNFETVNEICAQIQELVSLGVEVAVVIGGGNFWRGMSKKMERTSSDYMGMLATVMNGLALQSILQENGVDAILQTSIEIKGIAQPFMKSKAVEYLEQGKVVIFGGGTGNPYFTTDTAAALRAAEVDAEVILVGKTIDGVYTADPKIDKNAQKYDEITYLDILSKNLKVMDATSISLCRDNDIKLIVFELAKTENIIKAVRGEKIGTLIK